MGPRERLLRFSCGEGLSLGCSPTLADIEDLARREGVRSLVNLNTEGEPDEILSPNVEASWAHAFVLRHERVSFVAEHPRIQDVDRFLRVLGSVPRPAFVHSRHGRRAAAMILVHLGLERGISGTAAVLVAKGLGITCALDSLRAFAESEVDSRQGMPGRGPSGAQAVAAQNPGLPPGACSTLRIPGGNDAAVGEAPAPAPLAPSRGDGG